MRIKLRNLTMLCTQRCTRFLSRIFANLIYNITVVDETNIDTRYPTIIVSNHRHMVDSFVIAAYIPKQILSSSFLIRAMTARGYYYNKLLHLYLWGMACFPSKTVKPHKYVGVEGANKILGEGHGILIFPEGKRVSKDEQPRIYPGIDHIRSLVQDCNIVLAKIEYMKGYGRRTELKLCFFQESLDNKDASGIMKLIYQKEFSDHA